MDNYATHKTPAVRR